MPWDLVLGFVEILEVTVLGEKAILPLVLTSKSDHWSYLDPKPHH